MKKKKKKELKFNPNKTKEDEWMLAISF